MTEANYIKNYKTDHSRFGGRIYLSDFETDYPTTISDIAARITSDRKFDEMCRKNMRNKKYKKEMNK